METATPPPLDDLALVTRARAAGLLEVSIRTVDNMVKRGALEDHFIGSIRRITVASLRKAMQPTTNKKTK